MSRKNFWYPCLLAGFTLLLLYLIVPDGYLFGSNTDWFSQHVGIADYLRKTFYEQKTLFPDFSNLAAGSNFYSYSYYGYLRPDILIGCLLPMISMKYVIIVYSIAGAVASVLLFYLFLRKQNLEAFYCFLGGFFMSCSTCFFHAHMQIMFVNYLPFLLLALMSADRLKQKKKMGSLIASLFFVYLHSFYFSIACIFVCLLYLWHSGMTKDLFFRFSLCVAVSVSMAGILLLPTAFVLLEHKKDTAATSLREILGINDTLSSLLYSRYGCGTTLISLYALLLGIRQKESRRLCVTLLLCMCVNLVAYVLNGTLYVRSKILIPFLPLVLLNCVFILRKLMQGTISHSLVAYLLCLIPFFRQDPDVWMLLDAGLLLCFLLLTKKCLQPALCLILTAAPALIYVQTGRMDVFVPAEDKRQTLFSSEEIASVYQDSNARFDCLVEPLANANYLAVPDAKKTSVYSSNTNTLYSRFFYDIIKNPIRINNRVALLPDANPFFESLMGVRYLETHADKVPYGYQVLKKRSDENGNYVLAENPDVLPIAYASYNLLGEEQFDRLNYPYTLDTIANNTVVPGSLDNGYTSKIQPYQLPEPDLELSSIQCTHPEEDSYELKIEEEASATIPLGASFFNKILMISFQVESLDGKEVSISINHSKNKLSNAGAPYPNRNFTFTYILSSNQDWDCLNITFSPGHYRISQFQAYQMDAEELGNSSAVPLQLESPKGKEVLNGQITMESDGYFVTSLPYQKGYTALVDGKERKIEIVNKAFVGFPLEKGEHEVVLVFHAPGKRAGIFFSLTGFLLFALTFLHSRRKSSLHPDVQRQGA